MACQESDNSKCCTFIWKIENVSYYLPNDESFLVSPKFVVDEMRETNWTLEITFSHLERRGFIIMALQRHDNHEYVQFIKIDCEFAFLASDGRVLHTWEDKDVVLKPNDFLVTSDFISRNEVFFARRSVFLPHNTLTARCRIWKSAGTKFSKDVQCFARSRVVVEKRSFLWNVENFSRKSDEVQYYKIASISTHKELMTLRLFLTGGFTCDELYRVACMPNFENIKVASIKLSILDDFKNSVKCFQDEFWPEDVCDEHEYYKVKEFILLYTKRELLENKSTYLPNDVLSLWCECTFSSGTVLEEIEMTNIDCSTVVKKESDKHSLKEANNVPVSCCILADNLKSMLNNSWLSDVKLKTKSQTFDAHTFILGARSPLFKDMFSNDVKEIIQESVDIDDLNYNTVLRLLRYIYSAEVEDLDWASATELYEAADKYQMASLKKICSSYLKRNLCAKNSCDTLVFADMHKDVDLKGCVQDYILRHGKDIINSKKWDQLMKKNWKLAAETMRLKFKE